MQKEDILIKRDLEPLLELEWHTSLYGKVANICFRNIWHYTILIEGMKDLLRIVDPPRLNKNVDYYKELRDKATPLQTKIYYHNKIKKIFYSANSLLTNLTSVDENFLDLNREDIRQILDKKELEYEVKTYKQKLLKKQ